MERVFAAVAERHEDEDDESNSLEDEDGSEDGRKKFGAVAIFKIPDEVDISHLSCPAASASVLSCACACSPEIRIRFRFRVFIAVVAKSLQSICSLYAFFADMQELRILLRNRNWVPLQAGRWPRLFLCYICTKKEEE